MNCRGMRSVLFMLADGRLSGSMKLPLLQPMTTDMALQQPVF